MLFSRLLKKWSDSGELVAKDKRAYLSVRSFIFEGAGERDRTAISSLARTYNSHYTTPAFLICAAGQD